MPRDGFALAVFVSGEHEGLFALHRIAKFLDLGRFLLRHFVERREARIHIDAVVRPPFLAMLFGKRARIWHKVADVTNARQHLIIFTEVAADGLGLCRGLYDDELCCHSVLTSNTSRNGQYSILTLNILGSVRLWAISHERVDTLN